MTTTRKLLLAYGVVAVLTLIFQLWVRSGVCGDACTLSFAKAVAWAVIWPVSWIVYLAGQWRDILQWLSIWLSI